MVEENKLQKSRDMFYVRIKNVADKASQAQESDQVEQKKASREIAV